MTINRARDTDPECRTASPAALRPLCIIAIAGMTPPSVATPRLPRLLRLFVLRLGADFGFGANHLAEPRTVAFVQAFVLAGHALVAGGHHLPRVLFPGVERLLFFL